MEASIVDDDLWRLIEPLLPPEKPRREKHPGRLPISNRAALSGVLLVLKTGIRWNHLPTRLGVSSGATCWRRLRNWQETACGTGCTNCCSPVCAKVGQLDFSRAAVDSSSIRAVGAGEKLVRSARHDSKHHIFLDANGVPVSVILTGTNRNDVTQLLPLVDAIPPIRGVRGRPLRKPQVIYVDGGYDSEPHRQRVRERGTKPVIARRRTEHDSGLGKFRWVVERTHTWTHSFRRLRIRFESRADIHEAFLKLGCSLVCWNSFRHTE